MLPLTASELARVFRNRRVLVTGHTGFKGSWLSLWLHRLGAKVSGLALEPPTEPSNFALSRIESLLQHHRIGDVRTPATVEASFDETDPEVVFHLAAQPLVRESYRTPADTFETNVMGTARVLDAVRARGKPCAVVVITTDKCYENREQVWGYRENDPMGGFDPYSASKGAAELLVASYRRSYFLPALICAPTGAAHRRAQLSARGAAARHHGVSLATVRAGNVIGGGDWAADRIVTDIVGHLSKNRPVPVRNPHAVRPWQHVLEPLSGYLLLAARMLQEPSPAWSSGWNFGPRAGDERPVGQLVQLFCQGWGKGKWEDVSDPNAPHEAKILRLVIDKATWDLGWSPRWSIEETVVRTARWYRNVLTKRAGARRECLEDIAAYERAMAPKDHKPRPAKPPKRK